METPADLTKGEAGEELYGLLRGLLDVEQRFRTMTKRKGLYAELESVLNFYAYDDEEDAMREMEHRAERKEEAFAEAGDLIPSAVHESPTEKAGGARRKPDSLVQPRLPLEDQTV